MKKTLEHCLDARLSALKMDDRKILQHISQGKSTKIKFSRWRLTVVAACLTLLLTVTALAASLNLFGIFFKDRAKLLDNDAASINKSVEVNGIIFTVESAYLSDQVGYLIANFKKSDGTQFEDMGEDFYYPGYFAKIAEQSGPIIYFPIKGSLSEDNRIISVLFRMDSQSRTKTMEQQHLQGGSKLNVFVKSLSLSHERESIVQGPWSVEITLPTNNTLKEYDLNETTVSIEGGNATFLSVRMSPVVFIFKARGDRDLLFSAMQYLKYEKQDGTVAKVNGNCTGQKELSDSEYELTFSLSEPLNIDEVKSFVLLGKHALLEK